MESALRAKELVERFSLHASPVAVSAGVTLAYRRARQFADVGAALSSLAEPLERSLANGWFTLAAQIGVACLSLSVARSRYGDALRWYEWLSSVNPARLPARKAATQPEPLPVRGPSGVSVDAGQR